MRKRKLSRHHIAYAMELHAMGYSWAQIDIIFGTAYMVMYKAVKRAEDRPEAYPEVTTGVFPIDVERAGRPKGSAGIHFDPTDGEMTSLRRISEKHGINLHTLTSRIYRDDLSMAEAIK